LEAYRYSFERARPHLIDHGDEARYNAIKENITKLFEAVDQASQLEEGLLNSEQRKAIFADFEKAKANLGK